MDSGRKSGHGRVVLLYFESCEEIWGGSPATTTIASGIESTEIPEEIEANSNSPASSELTSSFDNEAEQSESPSQDQEKTETETSQGEETPGSGTIKERRDLLNTRLKGYKQDKLKRKLSVDHQLLNLAQEEIEIKKQLLGKMNSMDKEYSDHMGRLTTSMERLTGSIAEGFTMLRQMMLRSGTMPLHAPPHFQHHRPVIRTWGTITIYQHIPETQDPARALSNSHTHNHCFLMMITTFNSQ